MSFHDRVHDFWNWFPTIAGPLSDAIDANELHLYRDDFGIEFAEKLGPLDWEFGRDTDSRRFTLAVSPGGTELNSLLTHYWLEHQVEIPGWDFFSSKQALSPAELDNTTLMIGDQLVSPTDVQIDAQLDEASRKMNIQAWHPAFANLPADQRLQILFVMLDAALGEQNVQTKIGSIEIHELSQFVSLEKLAQFLDYSWSERGWPPLGPLDNLHAYQPGKNAHSLGEFRRSDIIAGTTVIPKLLGEFVLRRGALPEDPLAEFGASLAYLKLNFAPLDPKSAAAILTKVRKGLEHKLEQRNTAAYVVGASIGSSFNYIDLVLFDRRRSLDAVAEILPVLGVDGGWSIEWFASRRRTSES